MMAHWNRTSSTQSHCLKRPVHFYWDYTLQKSLNHLQTGVPIVGKLGEKDENNILLKCIASQHSLIPSNLTLFYCYHLFLQYITVKSGMW